MCFRPPTTITPKKCPECGVLNPGNIDTCAKCGADLPEAEKQKVECPRCGTLMDEDAARCAGCGITKPEIEHQQQSWQICDNCHARNDGLSYRCYKCKADLFPFGEEYAAVREENRKRNEQAPAPAPPSAPAAPKAPGMPRSPKPPAVPR